MNRFCGCSAHVRRVPAVCGDGAAVFHRFAILFRQFGRFCSPAAGGEKPCAAIDRTNRTIWEQCGGDQDQAASQPDHHARRCSPKAGPAACRRIWRPHGDSNPGLRRERAPSWASRRWGPIAAANRAPREAHQIQERPRTRKRFQFCSGKISPEQSGI